MADKIYHVGIAFEASGPGLKSVSRETKELRSQIAGTAAESRILGTSMFMGSARAAAGYAKVGSIIGAAGLAGALGMAATSGFSFNKTMESSKNAIVGTLQLYNHSAGAADQLGSNVAVAEAAMARLIDVANKSPGELEDVQGLFQNMLPGARSVTGSMERIMALTKKTAMLTPTLTNGDFLTAGSQISRMLTGGAGGEMDSWKRLNKVIIEVGQNMEKAGGGGKIFGKNQREGDDLTRAFNQLGGEDRLRLIEEALGRSGGTMDKMFAESWDGASSTFKSGWKQISAAGVKPLYEATKRALVRATGEGGVFSESSVKRLQNAAASVGGVFVKGAERGFQRVEGTIAYLEKNWEKVANSFYHALQIGSGLIKGAFAFGFTKMALGASLMAASGAVAGVRGVARGAGKMVGAGRGAVGAARSAIGFARFVNDFGSFGTLIKSGATSVAMFSAALIPMVAMAGVLALAFGGVVVAMAGVGAYIASEWNTIMGDVRQGFADGTLTVRPLVESALLLWHKLKLIGEALVGGATGATMFESGLNMAVGAVDLVTSAVIGLAKVAAGLLDMVGAASEFMNDPLGGNAIKKNLAEKILADPKASLRDKELARAARDEVRAAEAGKTDWHGMADSVRAAADRADAASLKDLDLKQVEEYTKSLEGMLTSGDAEEGKKGRPRGGNTYINQVVITNNMREPDPDRVMLQLADPLSRAAKFRTSVNRRRGL